MKEWDGSAGKKITKDPSFVSENKHAEKEEDVFTVPKERKTEICRASGWHKGSESKGKNADEEMKSEKQLNKRGEHTWSPFRGDRDGVTFQRKRKKHQIKIVYKYVL